MYEIIYDYDDGWTEHRNVIEEFTGSWTELQAYIKTMRKHGCYNITASIIREEIA